jgi:hypothetical protein
VLCSRQISDSEGGGADSATTNPGEENAPRLQVQIHEIERDATLQVAMYPAYGCLFSDVDYLKVREVRLCNGLIYGLIFLNTPEEIPLRVFGRHVLIIWITHADFQRDIGGDDVRVIADGFQKYERHPFLFSNPLLDIGPAEGAVSDSMWSSLGETNLRALVLFVASSFA